MSTEDNKQTQDSWKEITFLGIASVFMLVLLCFSVRLTFMLTEPLNAVKYGALTAMRLEEMQKRMDDMEKRMERLEVNGKKITFPSYGIMIGTENMQSVKTRESSEND